VFRHDVRNIATQEDAMRQEIFPQRGRPLDPAAVLPEVIAAVQDAGAILRAEFHRPGGPRSQENHAMIDVEIERRLRDRLLPLGAAGWLGAETGRLIARSAFTWIVNPNDGTFAFLKRIRGSSVSVALLRDGRPVVGVVYAPTAPDDRGDLVAWAEGQPLTRNGAIAPPPRQSNALDWRAVVALSERAADYAAANTRCLSPARFLAIPSNAYRLALAAVGDVDAAISLGSGIAPHDIAGGHALLVGAGRALADLDGAPIIYGEGSGYAGCIGGSPALIDALARRDLRGAVGKGYLKRHAFPPPSRSQFPQRLARAQGVLLGQLAGDALGSAVEFLGAGEIWRRHPNGVRDLAPGGAWDLIAGQPTDDSEMALALARSLVARGGFDHNAVGQAYVAWRQSGPFDIGATTSAGIAAIAAGRGAASDSQANGALMRVSPIGVFAAGDPARAADLGERDAALTHPNPVCRAASRAYCAAIAVGVAGGEPEAMWSAACAHAGDDPGARSVRATLYAARSGGPATFEKNKGWVLKALQNAFRWLLSGAPLEDAVIATVAERGDTDTNAAICGALIGACQGRDAVPTRWRRLILSCRPLPGPGVAHPRPMAYWPDDALDLAEALLAAKGASA